MVLVVCYGDRAESVFFREMNMPGDGEDEEDEYLLLIMFTSLLCRY